MKCKDCAFLYRTASQYSNRYLCLKHNVYIRRPTRWSCPEHRPKGGMCDANPKFNCSTCNQRDECLAGRENLEK